MGLVELLVVMSLMTLALTMFGMAFSVMLRTSDASRDIGAVTDQARLALNDLDRQIRFGYWIKTVTVGCATECPAIQVLTKDSGGTMQCWTWAIDKANGRLMNFHYPITAKKPIPSLANFGKGPGGWHIAAGPEGGPVADEVAIGSTSTLAVVSTSEVTPLDPTTLTKVSYFSSAFAQLVISKPGRPPITIEFDMSVRNQWIGAQYAGACA